MSAIPIRKEYRNLQPQDVLPQLWSPWNTKMARLYAFLRAGRNFPFESARTGKEEIEPCREDAEYGSFSSCSHNHLLFGQLLSFFDGSSIHIWKAKKKRIF